MLLKFLLLIVVIFLLSFCSSYEVSFDGRSFFVDGERILFIAGSIHYPRAPRSEWKTILQSAKDQGLNLIQTYVFWDIHEPQKDSFYFPSDPTSNYDLVAFIEEAATAGLYVHLRIAGYICAEWNYGGLPVWLRELNGSTWRTYDELWMEELAEYIEKTIDVVKSSHLLAVDGGPIVMLQIENEYGNMEPYYGPNGAKYVQWLSEYALSLNSVVGNIPWVMCQQGEGHGSAPAEEIVNTCNGYYCDEWIATHASDFPNQPHAFTENWPGWFQKWGDPVPHRPASDVAFSVARWFAKGGTYMNYYMQFGGTTFGRHVGGPSIITSYDYDVAINEYSLHAEPKYSHLQQLHRILNDFSSVLLSQMPPEGILLNGTLQSKCEMHLYGNFTSRENFIAFLSNWNSDSEASCSFYINELHLSVEVPAWSVSILTGSSVETYDVFNTKNFIENITPNKLSPTIVEDFKLTFLSLTQETVPSTICSAASSESELCSATPREQLSVTKDTTDYLWYTTSIPFKTLTILSDGSYGVTLKFTRGGGGGEIFYVYIDGTIVHNTGISNSEKRKLELSIILPPGTYSEYLTLSILSVSMGLQNYGPYLEKISVGIISTVTANDYVLVDYAHSVGLQSENSVGYSFSHIRTSLQTTCEGLCWYQLTFLTPVSLSGRKAVALDLSSMGKGFLYVNGHMLGRFWNITSGGINGYSCDPCDEMSYSGSYSESKCRTGCSSLSQRYYKLPSDWLSPYGEVNSLVVFDEFGGTNPLMITMITMSMIDD